MRVPSYTVVTGDGQLVVTIDLPDVASVASVNLMIAADCLKLDGCR